MPLLSPFPTLLLPNLTLLLSSPSLGLCEPSQFLQASGDPDLHGRLQGRLSEGLREHAARAQQATYVFYRQGSPPGWSSGENRHMPAETDRFIIFIIVNSQAILPIWLQIHFPTIKYMQK